MKNMVLGLMAFLFFVFPVYGQSLMGTAQEPEFEVVRGGCMAVQSDGGRLNRSASPMPLRMLKEPSMEWDAERTYRQLVVLVEFSDVQFNSNRDVDFYNRLFNEFSPDLFEGYTRYGKGCVADYFREQSLGKLNLAFDVVGPYRLDVVARPSRKVDHKSSELRSAALQMVAQETERDFSVYDWDGNGYIEQVVFVCAGPSGNVTVNGESSVGYLHPNTGSFSSVTTHDDLKISNYSASAEKWFPGYELNCGIGTVCHEFGHSLGLPDLYNTSNYAAVVDEWDIMDAGNVTNYGWCPPDYSPFERMSLGWLDAVELSEPTTVSGLLPVSEDGQVYVVYHTADEFYLLENRQQRGWDAGVPGSGLVVWHINYKSGRWMANSPNNYADLGVQLVHADNMDADGWLSYIEEKMLNRYANASNMNNLCLSGSPYPYMYSEGGVADSITDSSVPQSVMYNTNDVGSTMLSKSITNIRVSEDGAVSFDFMGGAPTSIREVSDVTEDEEVWYDLMGRRVVRLEKGRMYVGKKGKMVVR